MNWLLTEELRQPTADEIIVYAFDLDILPNQYQYLSTDEQKHADNMPIAKVKQHFINARGILHRLLQTDTPLQKNQHGKPYLNNSSLRFNVSHSHQFAVIALTQETDIGVDIEQVREINDLPAIAKRVFSEQELKLSQNNNGFFRLWTRKEAVIKCTGEGLFANMTRISTHEDIAHYPDHPEINIYNLPQYHDCFVALASPERDKIIRTFHLNSSEKIEAKDYNN